MEMDDVSVDLAASQDIDGRIQKHVGSMLEQIEEFKGNLNAIFAGTELAAAMPQIEAVINYYRQEFVGLNELARGLSSNLLASAERAVEIDHDLYRLYSG